MKPQKHTPKHFCKQIYSLTSVQAPGQQVPLASGTLKVRRRAVNKSAGLSSLSLRPSTVSKLWTHNQEPLRRRFWRHQPVKTKKTVISEHPCSHSVWCNKKKNNTVQLVCLDSKLFQLCYTEIAFQDNFWWCIFNVQHDSYLLTKAAVYNNYKKTYQICDEDFILLFLCSCGFLKPPEDTCKSVQKAKGTVYIIWAACRLLYKTMHTNWVWLPLGGLNRTLSTINLIDSYLKKVWCSMHTFHSLLAALWLESLKPIVLSNCSYWKGERIERRRSTVRKGEGGTVPHAFILLFLGPPQC